MLSDRLRGAAILSWRSAFRTLRTEPGKPIGAPLIASHSVMGEERPIGIAALLDRSNPH
jgi:hypothetical protein